MLPCAGPLRAPSGLVSQQALFYAVSVDPSQVVGLLNDLEALSLILRSRSPIDRLRHIVEISRRGLARGDAALAGAAPVESQLLAALDDQQRAHLQNLLSLVVEGSGLGAYCKEVEIGAGPG